VRSDFDGGITVVVESKDPDPAGKDSTSSRFRRLLLTLPALEREFVAATVAAIAAVSALMPGWPWVLEDIFPSCFCSLLVTAEFKPETAAPLAFPIQLPLLRLPSVVAVLAPAELFDRFMIFAASSKEDVVGTTVGPVWDDSSAISLPLQLLSPSVETLSLSLS
jgi:hypothetical protein